MHPWRLLISTCWDSQTRNFETYSYLEKLGFSILDFSFSRRFFSVPYPYGTLWPKRIFTILNSKVTWRDTGSNNGRLLCFRLKLQHPGRGHLLPMIPQTPREKLDPRTFEKSFSRLRCGSLAIGWKNPIQPLRAWWSGGIWRNSS